MADRASNTAIRHEPRHKPKAPFEQWATAAMEKHLPTGRSTRSTR